MARRLRTLADLRRYVGSIIRRLEESHGGDLTPELAGRLGYLANILSGIVKDSDLEARVRSLEQKLKTQGR